MISKEEVKHIAELARLGLTDKEIEEYQKDLSSVLDYVEKLKKIDVSQAEPTSHPWLLKNAMRQDESKPQAAGLKRKLVETAPDKKDGYVKVKAIL